jgi:hypothetical protein
MQSPFQNTIEKHIRFIRVLMKAALIVSSLSLLLSSFLLLLFGPINSITYYSIYAVIIWYSLMLCMWTFIFTIVSIIIILLYQTIRKKPTWKFVKKEIILLVINVICCSILYIIKFSQ